VLATDAKGMIVGYAMRKVSGEVLMRYGQPAFRRQVPQADVKTYSFSSRSPSSTRSTGKPAEGCA
jgi:hypothetical protein